MGLKIAHLNYVEDEDEKNSVDKCFTEKNSDDLEEINIVLMRTEVSEHQFCIV